MEGLDATVELVGDEVQVTLRAGEIEATRRTRVGPLGRHGHQGWVAPSWAMFGGEVLGEPPPGVGAEDLVRVRIIAPEGWRIASPIPPEGAPWSVVASSCFGVGDLEAREVPLGGGAATVWAWRPELLDGAETLLRWFHDEVGFSPEGPYAVVLTPNAPDGAGVFGGSSATGTCFDHDGGRRGWELLAHRVGHAIDRYPPAGFHVADLRDAWFVEGWASYVEVVATEATGLAPDRRRLDELARRHHEALARHPAWAVPLASEPAQRGELREHLHYVVGPLVAARLDEALRARTGRSLQAFVRHRLTTRRGQGVALRAELERWSGAPLDGFWRQWVDAPVSSPP